MLSINLDIFPMSSSSVIRSINSSTANSVNDFS